MTRVDLGRGEVVPGRFSARRKLLQRRDAMGRTYLQHDDPRLAPYRDLPGREASGAHFIVEGELAVLRLLQSPYMVESVVVTPSRIDRVAPWVPANVPMWCVESEVLHCVTGFDFHRGCMACAYRPSRDDLDPEFHVARLLPRTNARIVVAERLADPVNVGSLMRNCYALGVDLLVLDAKGADPWTRRAIRAAMGSVFEQPLAIAPDVADWVRDFSLRFSPSWRILAATVETEAAPIASVDPSGSLVLLVGNEGAGLSQKLRAHATQQVTIPLCRGFDSLNVAAATAILLDRLCPR